MERVEQSFSRSLLSLFGGTQDLVLHPLCVEVIPPGSLGGEGFPGHVLQEQPVFQLTQALSEALKVLLLPAVPVPLTAWCPGSLR